MIHNFKVHRPYKIVRVGTYNGFRYKIMQPFKWWLLGFSSIYHNVVERKAYLNDEIICFDTKNKAHEFVENEIIKNKTEEVVVFDSTKH